MRLHVTFTPFSALKQFKTCYSYQRYNFLFTTTLIIIIRNCINHRYFRKAASLSDTSIFVLSFFLDVNQSDLEHSRISPTSKKAANRSIYNVYLITNVQRK